MVPWPLSILPGLPREFTRLLEKDPGGRKDAALQFSDPGAFADLKHWAPGVPKAFGYSMWERLPLLHSDLGWRPDERYLAQWRPFSGYLRGMAVTCPMNIDAFRNVDPDLAMTVVPCGIEPDDWPVHDRRGDDRPFRFLLIGMLTAARKDAFCVLEAWQWLKANRPEFDAELTVHTYAPGLHSSIATAYGPGITFSSKPLSRKELIELYHSADVLVTPSRGEGNNKPAMEFMATGGTVLASEWSGHLNWMHPDVTLPLKGTLTPCIGQPDAVEYVVDPQTCAEGMLWAWAHQRAVREMGDLAAPFIRQRCAWDVLVPKLVDWMEQV